VAGDDEPPRSAGARLAAELALVRVVHHYGERPEFVLLGGLVPALLCAGSPRRHAGTTDVDVQVNLEIAGGAVNAARLEQALRNAEFEPDDDRVWRWNLRDPSGRRATVKFELLADLDTEPEGATVSFAECERLGAANLRGTGYAVRDTHVHRLTANDHGTRREAEINITGLAGFLLAKVAAAYGRRKPKDWYDIAFVLLHNDLGDVSAAADRVLDVFGAPVGNVRTQLTDLRANYDAATAQGTLAYVDQLTLDHPEVEPAVAAADAQLAVQSFVDALLGTTTP
jgi:nucleotidyltransferase AbiEii toxin of type IV toxin-antitoxin system